MNSISGFCNFGEGIVVAIIINHKHDFVHSGWNRRNDFHIVFRRITDNFSDYLLLTGNDNPNTKKYRENEIFFDYFFRHDPG